jgi:hypothetical protein
MDSLGMSIVVRNPGWWVAALRSVEGKRGIMTDGATADACLASGHRAISNGDVPGLHSAVRQLWSLLPEGDPDRRKGASTVTR